MTLALSVQSSWRGFLETFEPLRADLYRYCRYLTRSPWDAEDLAQDTLARAFVTLGKMGEPPPNPKAWLFRVASNLWIDHQRHVQAAARSEPARAPGELASSAIDPRSIRESAGTLIATLSPQERAAVVLKDAFDISLDDIADMLSTTPNAIKAALHRGREKLGGEREPRDESASLTTSSSANEGVRAPIPAALDAFVAAFNARDLDRVAAVLLDNAIVEVVGATTLYSAADARARILPGMMFGSERIAQADTRGGIDARFMQGILPVPARLEVRAYRGELVVLSWYAHVDGDAVRAVNRVELEGDRIARLRNYFFNAELLVEVCEELGVPYRSNGHQFWLKEVA